MRLPKGCDDETTMRFRLARLCDASSQKAVAQRWGFSPAFINDVLAGRRHVTGVLAAMMGYERMVVFRKGRKAGSGAS